ncbi:MAG: right-handed parallel beta-helix repeat-containing protein [Bacteroidales bacterium]|jgi:poly(beta-D-mannuronate) lyase|nr:right-handed parallel beta-helix repeat-containing protein [Bacteroidales bacterium]
MKKLLIIFFILYHSLFIMFASPVSEINYLVKSAKAGDTIIIDNGEYNNISLKINTIGTKERPIVIIAQTAGEVVLTGNSTLRLAGEYIEIHGLKFTDGYAEKGAVIEFRNGNNVAKHCRVSNCAIINYTSPDRSTDNIWVDMYGQHNRFDHNTVFGKQNLGCVLVVQLNEECSQNNFHQIDHNYFSRPLLGSNSGEVIRVGNAQYSLTSSQTIIENNYFDKCNGEVEVVSIKACDNIVRNNIFNECQGVVALRHGNRNIVEGNAFYGNGIQNTGGIRVINAGHIIRNNYFEKLTGRRFFAALAIMNAVPNSLPNRYHQVKDVIIENNIWKNCDNIEFGVGADNERTLAPTNILLKNNDLGTTKIQYFSDKKGYKFENTVKTHNFASLLTLKTGCSFIHTENLNNHLLNRHIVEIANTQNSLADAVEKAHNGAVITLTEAGEYLNDRAIEVKKPIFIRAGLDLEGKITLRYNGTMRNPLIRICDGGSITVEGIHFDGNPVEGNANPVAAIAPAETMSTSFSLNAIHCKFYNFGENKFSAFRAIKGSFAEHITFDKCEFYNISGDALYFASQKEDDGTYNVENLIITNCYFHDILASGVNLYRGGSDESTAGPRLVFTNNKIERVDNREKGAAVRLVGVQNVLINNCEFIDSGRGGCFIRLDEASFDIINIKNIKRKNSGRIFSFYKKSIQ